MVQLAPRASELPQVPPAVPVGRENAPLVPIVKFPPLNPTLPVFVIVSVIGPLVVPVAQLPKARVAGDTVAVLTAATPVPVIGTGAPFTFALVEVIVSEAE